MLTHILLRLFIYQSLRLLASGQSASSSPGSWDDHVIGERIDQGTDDDAEHAGNDGGDEPGQKGLQGQRSFFAMTALQHFHTAELG